MSKQAQMGPGPDLPSAAALEAGLAQIQQAAAELERRRCLKLVMAEQPSQGFGLPAELEGLGPLEQVAIARLVYTEVMRARYSLLDLIATGTRDGEFSRKFKASETLLSVTAGHA